MKILKLGTRGSKLSLAQTRLIARYIEHTHPNIKVDIIPINSDGDRDKTTPLWQMARVGVFSHEIDEHLLAGKIDFAVHSLKDLGTQRPDGLFTAAVSKREWPGDVLFFRRDIVERLQRGDQIVIGSSAPRRIQLLPNFLKKALPRVGQHEAHIEVIPLRGNIDSRIQRLKIDRSDERALDGVCLAVAGVSRLAADAEFGAAFVDTIKPLKKMVLPLTVCPGAPGQASLAIETRTDALDIQQILRCVHDDESAQHILRERTFLLQQGGGCHQKFGALSLTLPHMQTPIFIVAGCNDSGQELSRIDCPVLNDLAHKRVWWGSQWRKQITQTTLLEATLPAQPAVIYATHSRAVPDGYRPSAPIWTSGVSSWFALAQQGHWVEGCADGFGFSFIESLINQAFLNHPPRDHWLILTHEAATKDWSHGNVKATYRVTYQPTAEAIAALTASDVVVWSSGSQYQALKHLAPQTIQHACGAGKTAQTLINDGLTPLVVPSINPH